VHFTVAERTEGVRFVAIVDSLFLEQLYRTYSRSVFRRASALMGDRDAGQDVMQEVFLRVFRARAEFDAAASPLAWLYRITTNICLNRLRDSGRRRDILDRARAPGEPSTEGNGDGAVEAALTVRALLGHVPEEVQEIAIYYFVDQMSQEEIATLLAIPRRTIAYRIERFRSLTRAAAHDGELAS
jgi:RNA polymerase sigma-70 factor (ECF subfamily)